MVRTLRRLSKTKPTAAIRDERGVAAVEFALLSTLLLTLLAGGVDLTHALTVQRDIERLSNEIVQALAACASETCVITNGFAINDRMVNIAPGLDGITFGFTNVMRTKDTIVASGGNMSYLPADMTPSAMSALANGDSGVASLITYTHRPIVLNFAKDWGFNLANFRSYAVTLRVKGS